MALRYIREEGDPILRKTCKKVKEVTPRIKTLAEDMLDTMYDANGCGLAAPQVGVLKRVIVVDVSEDENDPHVLINPVIVEQEGEQTGTEACLSLPGLAGIVTRPNYVKVQAVNENGEEVELEGTELLARCICHECDHLDGILYRDRAEGELFEPKDEDEDEEGEDGEGKETESSSESETKPEKGHDKTTGEEGA